MISTYSLLRRRLFACSGYKVFWNSWFICPWQCVPNTNLMNGADGGCKNSFRTCKCLVWLMASCLKWHKWTWRQKRRCYLLVCFQRFILLSWQLALLLFHPKLTHLHFMSILVPATVIYNHPFQKWSFLTNYKWAKDVSCQSFYLSRSDKN